MGEWGGLNLYCLLNNAALLDTDYLGLISGWKEWVVTITMLISTEFTETPPGPPKPPDRSIPDLPSKEGPAVLSVGTATQCALTAAGAYAIAKAFAIASGKVTISLLGKAAGGLLLVPKTMLIQDVNQNTSGWCCTDA